MSESICSYGLNDYLYMMEYYAANKNCLLRVCDARGECLL
jgi:hypothetical protein